MDAASQFFQNLIEYTQQRPLPQPYEVAVDSPDQNRLQQALPSFPGSYPPTFVNRSLPQRPDRGIETPHLQPQSILDSRRAHPPSAVSSASSLTENTGNSNRTINGSNGAFIRARDAANALMSSVPPVFYIQFAEASTPVSHTEIFSHPTQTPAPSNSQEPLLMAPTPPSTSSPQTEATPSYIDDRTPGQRYASLLSACKLGYPLWKPSPRRTDTGKEHIINIGDVGVPYDLDPFHTLFNITTYSGGLTGNIRTPEGVDPPCDIRGDVTIDTNYHEDGKLLARPQGSIARQTDSYLDLSARRSRGFGFRLSQKEGALLMLPRGSTLRKLQKTHEFKARLMRHWRSWYDFADVEGDLDEAQTLCLVTGVQQCRAWAMAVWDEMSENDPGGDSEFLTLTFDEVGDGCSWDRCPPRCSTQSLSSNSNTGTHETVFIRAFWISRRDGSFSTRGSPPPAGRDGDSSGDGNFGRHSRHRLNPFGRFQGTRYASQNPFNPFCSGSPSNTPSPPHNDSGQSSPSADRSASGVSTSDRCQIDESSIIRLGPEDTSKMLQVGHPCQVINALAFKLVSRALPFLLDAEFAAFSHDDDWISAVENFDGVFPEGIELLRHVCKKFKFVVEPEGDVVYTEILTSEEMELVRNGAHCETTLLPVLFQLRESEIHHNELLEVELNEEIKHIRLFESDSLSVEVTVEVGSSDTNNPARSPFWSASDYSTYSLFELRQQLAELNQEFEQPGLSRPLLTWQEERDEESVIEPLAVSCIFSTGKPFY
ncbi:hypothetical protein PQX77_017257 [Marasmius sp. AFHP31]|nr:hypothetical protein PQX77_017257 [Marasmius sp. AFHP31]